LQNVNNYCLCSCKSSLCSSDYLCLLTLFFSSVVSYMINNGTFKEVGQTRGSSAAAIQFSFRNRANFHSRFLCYQCVFDSVSLSTLLLLPSHPIWFAGDQRKCTIALKISVTVAAFIIFKGLIWFVRGFQRENFSKILEISFSAFLNCFRAF